MQKLNTTNECIVSALSGMISSSEQVYTTVKACLYNWYEYGYMKATKFKFASFIVSGSVYAFNLVAVFVMYYTHALNLSIFH